MKRRKFYYEEENKNMFSELYALVYNEVGGTRILEALVNWDYDVEEYDFLYELVNYELYWRDEVQDFLFDYGDQRTIERTVEKIIKDHGWDWS